MNTVKDVIALQFTVFLLQDAIRAVDVEPGNGNRVIEEMIQNGATPISFEDIHYMSGKS